MVKLLISYDPRIIDRTPGPRNLGFTALIGATLYGHTEIVKFVFNKSELGVRRRSD
jgi:hypothetical protein